jgi:WS/DGAT/MGAT family acyltransferase
MTTPVDRGGDAGTPRKLLVVSADIGEGHNATARAVEERAARLWPGCEIRRIDTLDEMGRWVGPAFRWIYRVNVDTTPWLYDFFYDALWRYRWFATASCRFVAAWSGRRLAPMVAGFRPDLVVSTYPLGTGGLDWIRRRSKLDVPVAAVVSDFAPHPFWVYSEIDLHYVASEQSLRAMHRAQPDARGAVGAPPVVSAFRAGDKIAARRRCGLPEDAMIVLVSCGSFGFGSMERVVGAALRARPEICVVVACGRNERLRARLAARAEPAHRLVPMGWTDHMPDLTAAADVIVTNAGGATALEALACHRAVLLFEPISGHGRANAALMERAGLGRVCHDPRALIAALDDLADPKQLAAAERRAQVHTEALDLDAEVAALPGLSRHFGARPLAASDALFALAATPMVPQHVGAVLLLDEQAALGPPERVADHVMALIAQRGRALPILRRRLEQRPGRRPRWLPVDDIEAARHVRARTVQRTPWSRAVEQFFAEPLPDDRPPWQLEVLHDAATGRTAVLAALHHALGDGLAITAALIGLLSDREDPTSRSATDGAVRAFGHRERVRAAVRLVRGLASLAAGGRAPAPRPAAASTPNRRLTMVGLPAAKVRSAARSYRTSTSALLLAVLAEALHQRGATTQARVAAMVPLTARAARRPDSTGNDTAAVRLNLPVGPMSPNRRIAEVSVELSHLDRVGQPDASRAVVHVLGRLPALLHARLARIVYSRRFFTLIASVLPGPRRAHHLLGARVTSVFPVLPLADGVGLAVGYLNWGDVIGVGVTTDSGLFPDGDEFADDLKRAFEDFAFDDHTDLAAGC